MDHNLQLNQFYEWEAGELKLKIKVTKQNIERDITETEIKVERNK